MGMCWEAWSWPYYRSPSETNSKTLKRQYWHAILFPSFGETNEIVIFLLVRANLCFSLVSLAQAQKAALFGQSQLILGCTKTQILYCWCTGWTVLSMTLLTQMCHNHCRRVWLLVVKDLKSSPNYFQYLFLPINNSVPGYLLRLL